MVYDNMRVAVKNLLEMKKTEALVKLSLYYGFHYRFVIQQAEMKKGM